MSLNALNVLMAAGSLFYVISLYPLAPIPTQTINSILFRYSYYYKPERHYYLQNKAYIC